MADTLTWGQLRELAAFRTENGCAISVYVNLDPSEVPTPRDAQTRMNALLAEAEKADRSDLAHDTRAGLRRDFDRIAETTSTARDLYDQVLALHPDRINPDALWLSAQAVKPSRPGQ